VRVVIEGGGGIVVVLWGGVIVLCMVVDKVMGKFDGHIGGGADIHRQRLEWLGYKL